jgi:hypothetical protein
MDLMIESFRETSFQDELEKWDKGLYKD